MANAGFRAQSEGVISEQSLVAFVPSTDLARSRRFYETVLGLRVVSEDGFAVVVATGTGTLRITNVGPNFAVQPFTVLGWQVDDLDAEIDLLAQHGVQFLDVPELPQDERSAWMAPDGTRVAYDVLVVATGAAARNSLVSLAFRATAAPSRGARPPTSR